MKGLNKDIVAEIRRIYEKIYDLCRDRFVGWSKLYDYAAFLYNQNDYAQAIKVAEKLNRYYSDPDNKVDEYDLGSLYNLLGLLYEAQNKPKKAEKYCLDSIEIYERLTKKNADAYEPDLAGSYNNAGAFYYKQNQPEKTEKYYLATIEIRKRLVEKNAAAYEPDLASSYFNYCFLKEDKTYLDKAYEIAKRRQDDPRCKTIVEFVESH